MLLSPANTDASLPSSGGGFFSKLLSKKNPQGSGDKGMALTKHRLVTLVFDEMETVRMLPPTFTELEVLARDWVKPPPDAQFALRIPVEYASFQAARFVTGTHIWLTSDDSYQIAIMGVQGSRVEIMTNAAAPPPDEPPPPPPPPVHEMDGIFNLELEKNKNVAIDVLISSEELDMARMEDGTTVAGSFWGKLDVVHDGETHKMEFSGTRLAEQNCDQNMLVDQRIIGKLALAAKPISAKCTLNIFAPEADYCEIEVVCSDMWSLGTIYPPPDSLSEKRFKYFFKAYPRGALEHFESQTVVTSVFYEAIPDPSMVDPAAMIAPHNSFAMPLKEFLPHISKKLDSLGLTLPQRTNFINSNMPAFAAHKNIAYRFMSPGRLARAIDILLNKDPCIWTRIFLIFRGIPDDEISGDFANAGEKESEAFNWADIVGYSQASKETSHFRVLEVSIFECT